MPKYKLRNFYKTLLQIWLFYYFLNTLEVHKCQHLEDVEIISSKTDENDVNDFHRESDSETFYEPIDPNKNNYHHNFDEIDDSKHVNLNVNNNLHESEVPPETGEVPTRFTEINEQEISGEKILYQSESPFLLRQDLDVLRNARLTVEPGVTVYFAPLVGITVQGQIKAIVSIPPLVIPRTCASFHILSTSIPDSLTLRQVYRKPSYQRNAPQNIPPRSINIFMFAPVHLTQLDPH